MNEKPAPAGDETPPGVNDTTAAAVLDERGRVIAWNDTASELLGYEVEEVLGTPAAELLAHDLPEDVRQRITDRREWAARAGVRRRSDGEIVLHLIAFPLSGARVALVVGDVVGHGVPAAAAMGRLSTAVRTLADMELPPEELLTHLDDLVITLGREHDDGEDRPLSGDTGSTCLYAVYDPITASCTMARAGHPPPALVTPDGLVEFPDLPSGPPLGVGGLPFETVRLPVPDGTLPAFYTNGVIGAAGGDMDVGFGLLRDTLHRHTGSLEQTCDSVIASLLSERPPDDLALLLVRTRTLDGSRVATWDLSTDPASVAEARRRISSRLADWGLEDLAFTTELIGSELVTNAIRYGGEPLQLRLIRESSLTCEVADSSGTVPRIRRARVLDEGGRGLLVVSQLADRWGSRHTDEGKVIWAEQFLPDR